MTTIEHERAQHLIDASHVESISAGDRAWLDAHLEACESCAGYAERTEQAIRAWRSVHIHTDPALVSRTRMRVRLRALELGAPGESMWPVWVSGALSCLCMVISAPYAWQWLSWLAARAGVPAGLLAGVAFLFWFTPVVAAALLVRHMTSEQREVSL